jgi:carbonic anhydrase
MRALQRLVASGSRFRAPVRGAVSARWCGDAPPTRQPSEKTPKEWSEGLEVGPDGSTTFSYDEDMLKVFAANKKWMAKMTAGDKDFFKKLGAPQTPDFFYIGCADSRVPANEIMGMGPGEVFVHRNVANLVVSTDLSMLSCLQYAVEVLKVKHIIVAGHHGCGGVQQAMKNESLGTIDAWLGNIRDIYRLHHKELDAIEDEDTRFRRLVELNVVEQCLNLYKTDVVQRKRLETWSDPEEEFAYPRIHALVFDPSVGELTKLNVDFRANISRFQHIYDLHGVPDYANDGSGPQDKHFMFRKRESSMAKNAAAQEE